MKNIYEKRKDANELHHIQIETLYPTDKMKLDPVKTLISDQVLKLLQSIPDDDIKEFTLYCEMLKKFYEAWNVNGNFATSIEKLETVYQYFSNWNTSKQKKEHFITEELFKMITISLNSLKTLRSRLIILFKKEPSLISILGTNIVENFFSTIRSKCRYPSLWDYSIVYNRAWIELVKQNAIDCPYSFREKKSSHQYYGNQQGLKFIMKDIIWDKNKGKKK